MKHLVYLFLTISINTFSQDKINKMEINQSYAGQELIKANNTHMGAIAVSTGGAFIAALGVKNNITPMIILGGGAMLAGTILNFVSWRHISNAGEYLNPKSDDEFTIGISPAGLNATYRF